MHYPEINIILTLFGLVVVFPTLGKLIRIFLLTKDTVQAFDSNNKHILKSYASLKNEILSLRAEVKSLEEINEKLEIKEPNNNYDNSSSFYQIKQKEITLLLFFIVSLFFIFIVFFSDEKSVYEMQIWIDSATFINNFFTPLILTITLFVIYKTWQTSKSELEDSRKELVRSRKIQNSTHTLELLRNRISILNSEMNKKIDEFEVRNGCILLQIEVIKKNLGTDLVNDIDNAIVKDYKFESEIISMSRKKGELSELDKLIVLNKNYTLENLFTPTSIELVVEAIKNNNLNDLIDYHSVVLSDFSNANCFILHRMFTYQSQNLISLIRKAHNLNEWVSNLGDQNLISMCKDEIAFLIGVEKFNLYVNSYKFYLDNVENKYPF